MADFGVWLQPPSGERIYLQSDREIRWRFRFGGSSPDQVLCVSENVDKQILAIDSVGPWSLWFYGPERYEEDLYGPANVGVEKIWLHLRGRSVGGNKVLWHMSDRRRALRNVYIDTFFNQMKVSNDFNRPADETVNPNVSILSKAGLNHFIPFTCQHSYTQEKGVPEVLAFSLDDKSYQPWTALKALYWFLTDASGGWLWCHNKDREVRGEPPLSDIDGTPFEFGDLVISDRVVDRKVWLRNWNPRKSWPGAVNELCRMARVGLYIDTNGYWTLEDLTPIPEIFEGYGKYAGGGGLPVRTTLSKTAPRSVRVHFPEFQEIRWEYDERYAAKLWEGKGLPNKLVHDAVMKEQSGERFLLENVLPLPQDVDDVDGSTLKAGTWVNVFHALKLWRDQAIKNPGVFGNRHSIYADSAHEVFEYQAVLKYSTTSALAHLWSKDFNRQEFRNQLVSARVAAIYQHFRKTFRIPEVWLDHIESIRPETGTIYANVSRSRQPSPVYLDHCAWDSTLMRYSTNSTGGSTTKVTGAVRNYPLDGDKAFIWTPSYADQGLNIYDKPTRNYTPFPGDAAAKDSWEVNIDSGSSGSSDKPAAPVRVSMIDPQRGVFQTNFTIDFSGIVINYRPGMYDPRSMHLKGAGELGSSMSWQGYLVFSKTFRMMTIMSIRWRTTNTAGRHFILTNQSASAIPGLGGSSAAALAALAVNPPYSAPEGASGPELDIYAANFEAFRKYEFGKVTWEKDTDRGMLEIKHEGGVQNIDVISELSLQHFERAYFRHIDLVLGTYRAPLWTGQFPVGNIRETSIVMSPTGVLETEVSGESLPALPSIWEFMSGNTRNVVAKFEAHANDRGMR